MIRITASALLIAMLLVVNASAQTETARIQQRAVREAMDRMNGTWVLVKRIRPDGKEHTKPYRGITTFNLTPSRATRTAIAGTTAVGTFTSTESGAMDSLMSHGGGAEAFILTESERSLKTFEITANGPVEITAMVSDARAAAGESIVAVTYHPLDIKGNYGVFRKGLKTPEVESVYRVAPDKSVRVKARSGRYVTQMQPGELSLINEPRMAAGSDARLAGSPEDPSHQVRHLTVNGNRMDITYGNGGRDVWMRRR